MMQCIKHLSCINLISLANQIAANNITNTGNSECNADFDKLFKWRTFKTGFDEAKFVQKPVFLYIHKFTCPACHKQKDRFAKSVRLMDLSERFVMIKIEMAGRDMQLLSAAQFQPDGKYVPRILFFTPDGVLIKEAYNKHSSADKEHRYFYSTAAQVIETMLYVLKEYTKDPTPLIFEHEDVMTEIYNMDMNDEVLTPTYLD